MDKSQYAAPDYTKWVLDVVGWDGLFPAFILAVSVAVAQFGPKNQAVAETLMVSLPIVGVLARFTMGRRKIALNHCAVWVRVIQLACLAIAVVLFMAFDFFVVLGAFIHDNQNVLSPADKLIFLGIAVTYIVLVTCAMYPGRQRVCHGATEPLWYSHGRTDRNARRMAPRDNPIHLPRSDGL